MVAHVRVERSFAALPQLAKSQFHAMIEKGVIREVFYEEAAGG